MDISVPKARERVTKRLEWLIETPCDAKNFTWALGVIENDMRSRGLDMSHDDAYRVKVTDEGILITRKVQS